jgi:hypothetical protein
LFAKKNNVFDPKQIGEKSELRKKKKAITPIRKRNVALKLSLQFYSLFLLDYHLTQTIFVVLGAIVLVYHFEASSFTHHYRTLLKSQPN